MGSAEEAVVRRFYEEMNNDRKNEIHRLADGKIAEAWQVWDTLGFLQQLGAVPAS
ncbi:hypothetical protein ACNJ7E_33390 [Rhodococcus sp. NM-2]|uniref:hypothetical protein n=1 Tax=Rhodococcus TaxID=1827 RepID=UPI002474700E|nr:hypothetical protein [Rhodococcus opacus]MDH6289297.1 hypothetical protein [Rhodococcus opacus]